MKVSENELIEYAKIYFKERGFKKAAKRWTKELDKFKLIFYIQGSCYDKNDYYIRPAIIIKALEPCNIPYGHFMKEIPVVSLPQIFEDTEDFFALWTNAEFIKERMTELTHCFDVGERRQKFFKDNGNVIIIPEREIAVAVLQNKI